MQSLEFPLAHITLRGVGYGDPEKPMVLALHGWLDNAASFAPLSKFLTDYYLVAIDMAGHGLSSNRSPDAHYHLMDFVYDIHELIQQQNWQKLILIGHSMGGIIATLYASCFPEKIASLVSIESFGPMTKESQSSPEQLRESILSRLKAQQSQAKHPTSLERTIKARAKAGDIQLKSARLLIERNVRQQDGRLYFNTDRRLRTISALRITEQQAEAFMRNIQCPVLVISGTQGYQSMRDTVQKRINWVTNLSTKSCEGYHHLHMDNAQAVAEQIDCFLAEQATGRSC